MVGVEPVKPGKYSEPYGQTPECPGTAATSAVPGIRPKSERRFGGFVRPEVSWPDRRRSAAVDFEQPHNFAACRTVRPRGAPAGFPEAVVSAVSRYRGQQLT